MPERRFDFRDLLRDEGLPPPDDETMALLEKIVDEGTLGASRHVELSHDLLVHIASSDTDAGTRRRKVQLAAEFIASTRGKDTPIIANSVQWLLTGADEEEDERLPEALRARAARWSDEAAERREAICATGSRLFQGPTTLALFDYSSTVSAVVARLAQGNRPVEAVVFESRAIDGGWPYVQELLPLGVRITYLPDMAIEHAMKRCDAILYGVESLRADGSFLNTIGSSLSALLAQGMGVPRYACTDLFKLDRNSYKGRLRAPSVRDYAATLLAERNVSEPEKIDTRSPELDVVEPWLLSAYITEHGLVPPMAIWHLGREVFPDIAERDQKARR